MGRGKVQQRYSATGQAPERPYGVSKQW